MKIQEAREKKGLTLYGACQLMPSVKWQSLKDLEEGIADPAGVKVRTMLEIMAAFYPDVSLEDFLGESQLFIVAPADPTAHDRLRLYGTPEVDRRSISQTARWARASDDERSAHGRAVWATRRDGDEEAD